MQNYQHQFVKDTPAAGEGEVVLWQTSASAEAPVRPEVYPSQTEFDIACIVSQNMTLLHKWGPTLDTADAAMTTINGTTGTGETITASAFYFKTLQLPPGRNRISVVAGVTPPTATKLACSTYTGPRVV